MASADTMVDASAKSIADACQQTSKDAYRVCFSERFNRLDELAKQSIIQFA